MFSCLSCPGDDAETPVPLSTTSDAHCSFLKKHPSVPLLFKLDCKLFIKLKTPPIDGHDGQVGELSNGVTSLLVYGAIDHRPVSLNCIAERPPRIQDYKLMSDNHGLIRGQESRRSRPFVLGDPPVARSIEADRYCCSLWISYWCPPCSWLSCGRRMEESDSREKMIARIAALVAYVGDYRILKDIFHN